MLDKTESDILRALATNARMPVLEIMKNTGLTRDVISYRIKKMGEEQILFQYRTLVDLSKIGLAPYKILLRLYNYSPEKENELIVFVKQRSGGMQFLKLMGSWDAELEFEVENEEQLHEILLELRKRFASITRDYDTLAIHKNYKFTFYPF